MTGDYLKSVCLYWIIHRVPSIRPEKVTGWPGERDQWLRTLPALTGNPDSVHSMHIDVHMQFQWIQSPLSGFWNTKCTYGAHAFLLNTHAHEIKYIFKKYHIVFPFEVHSVLEMDSVYIPG